MKKTTKTYTIIIVIGVITALIFYFFFRGNQERVVLQAELPAHGYIAQYVTATGKVEPVDTVSVGTQVSGIIKNLYVDFTSHVKKGELTAELDKSLLQATLDPDNGHLLHAQSHSASHKSNFL